MKQPRSWGNTEAGTKDKETYAFYIRARIQLYSLAYIAGELPAIFPERAAMLNGGALALIRNGRDNITNALLPQMMRSRSRQNYFSLMAVMAAIPVTISGASGFSAILKEEVAALTRSLSSRIPHSHHDR